MRRAILVAILLAGLLLPAAVIPSSITTQTQIAAAAQSLQLFGTPQAAQKHCPTDTVVWLNTRTGVYHYAGQRWYGNTEYGAYVCEREAIAAGDRATRNGQ